MKTGIKVCDAMTMQPVTAEYDMSISEAALLMKNQKVGALVVKKEKQIVGICTEQDIVRECVAENKNPYKTPIEEIMDQKLVTIEPQKDIFEALIVMRDRNFRHLPVMDGEKFVGLLTAKDILKIEPQLFDILVETIELREIERKQELGVVEIDPEYGKVKRA